MPGFVTFTAAGLATGNLVSYVIEDGTNFEIGQGTYTASGTTLARTTILASSSGGAAISVTANALVAATALASDLNAWVLSPNDNRIINGDMRIDQRNAGASGTAAGPTADRWVYNASVAAKGAWQRAAATLAGFPYQLQFVSSSAYAVLAGDFFSFSEAIEADMVSDFAWGTAGAQPVTLSFWVVSSLTGTFGGAIQNYALTRSYPFTYSIPVASTWTKIVITIPGDTTGTWVMSGSGGAANLHFSLGMGSTRCGTANAWASANYLSATGSVSVVGTNGAGLGVAGVKLEIGSIATPFNRQSLTKSFADCQRYYQTGNIVSSGYGTAGMNIYVSAPFLVAMRGSPTNAVTPNLATNCSTFTLTSASAQFAYLGVIVSATGGYTANASYTLASEL